MDSQKKVGASRLHPFKVLAGLRTEDLDNIAGYFRQATAQSGSILIRQGQVGKDVYLLEEGSVGVYRGESDTPPLLAVLHAPTIFGEMALLDTERIRTASVKALSNLRLFTIQIDDFLSILRRFPVMKHNLRYLVSERNSIRLL